MSRFQVYKIKKGRNALLVVDVQADIFSHFESRIVIPLLKQSEMPKALIRLHPVLNVNGVPYILMTTDMASISPAVLGEAIGTVKDQHHAITDAIDFLLQGYR